MSTVTERHAPGSGRQATSRPRITGEREAEILDAALLLLREVGYDRLTMDALAASAHVSKASLYRRWANKGDLVIDVVVRADHCAPLTVPDTGTLRGDLLAMACDKGGLGDEVPVDLLASLITAMHLDPDLAAAFERSFMAPRVAVNRLLFDRALARGEIRDDVDLDLVLDVLPGVVLHRLFLRREAPTPELMMKVVDTVVLPAVLAK
ncbi:TetR/AcrR family transcriptional regulator [Angustibacter aerolatus]|uniref:TetR family transcriptional regulator n=1 Tax=Angustibacter aerolatus TaxID=1162965 RepID=A0ABQ6JR93_9ACTN|nr:TetR/AcrR family transcriptional regulator [Angustibacter aerolatus]GMA89342.1 TetR family transcriptional regulator [Angustibacter aerolatus]